MKSEEHLNVPNATGNTLPNEIVWNALDDPMILIDATGQVIFANQACGRLTGGIERGDLLTKIISAEYLAALNRAMAQVLSSPGQRADVPIEVNDSTGNVFTMTATLKSLSDEQQLSWCVLTLHSAHAGEFKAFDQLRSDLEHKKSIIEAVVDSTISMISVVDRNFTYILFNQKTEEYTRTSKDSVLGKNVFEVFPYLKQTDYEANVKRALNGEIVYAETSRSVLQKGRYFETYYIPLRTGTSIDHVIVKVRDKTADITLRQKLIEANHQLEMQNRELKRQSQFIESLFDSTIDVIAVIDKEFRYLSINKRAAERYKISKDEIRGKKITDLFPSVVDSGMYRDIQRALQGEFVYDLRYTSEVLNQSHFQNYYVPLVDDVNAVYAVMVIGHDITEFQNASEQLRISNAILAEKNRELERSNADLEQFAYVASHDLQEPIRKIATYANKLLTRSKENLGDETTVYLERINKSTRRMYELINGLLLYSRLTREESLFTTISLEEVVRHLMADFEFPIRQKKAVFNIQHLPKIEAVPVQMNQLFTNLISNSLKFAKKDVAPVIQIAGRELTEEQKRFYNLNLKARYINLFYLDNGIGFDQQYADKVFELFQRLHDKHHYEGSGIGLAICKKIVSNHHGIISAFSEEGKGTTFQIILPYQQKPFA